MNYIDQMTGGVDFSGPDKWLLAIFVNTLGDGGVSLSGAGQIRYGQAAFFDEMLGGPLIQGSADTFQEYAVATEMTGGVLMGGSIKDRSGYRYSGTGIVYVGNIGSTDSGNTLYFDLVSQWNTASSFEVDFTTSWTIGPQRLYWYRVQGACAPLACPPVAFDKIPDTSPGHSCNKTIFLVNVLASSLQDVCNQLTANHLVRRIDMIHKFSRPASRDDQAADAALGIDHSCNVLTEVPFCSIPACLNFCVDYDVTTSLGTLSAVPIIGSFEMSGGVTIQGTGSAGEFHKSEVMTGGVSTGGGSDYTTQNYGDAETDLPGGLAVGGIAEIVAQEWKDDSFGGTNLAGEAVVISSSFSFGGD